MNYVYILHSRVDDKLYIGCTDNLKRRIGDHNNKRVFSTKNRAPLELLHYEAFINKSDAFAREQWLKTGFGRNHMKKMLSGTLKSLGG